MIPHTSDHRTKPALPPAVAGRQAFAPQPQRAHASLEARLLRRLLVALGDPPLDFRLWTGEQVLSGAGAPVARLHLLNRATLLGILRDPQLRLGDAYMTGELLIEGDLVALMLALYRSGALANSERFIARQLAGWLHRPRRNSLSAARDNIGHHYNLGNDFYRLWLGATMAYTCAYYPTADTALDTAQLAKMDHVCRKLQLRAGDNVVEAGCGWGGLALHMAQHYGARVRAFNISSEQLAYARQQARARGLEGQVEFIEDDYRNIGSNIGGHGSARSDVFASIGMLEHVGTGHYAELGRVARRALGPQGRGLIHSIGRNYPEPLHPWIERRIFPGAYAPSLGEMMQIFEPSNLAVLDVENLRQHYALTLRHWLQNFEAVAERVAASFDENFVRMWRLYLCGSIAAFESGTLQLFQVLFTTAENNDLPLTRRFMYPD